MNEILVEEENTVYELDPECLIKKRMPNQKASSFIRNH